MVPEEEELDEGVEETEDAVVVDLGTRPSDEEPPEEGESEGEPEEETEAEEEEPKESPKEGPKKEAAPDMGAFLDQAKEELRKEFAPPKEEKKVYTDDELDAAEDKLDSMVEDGEITRVEYRRYLRNIARIRDENREVRLRDDIRTTQRRETAESAVTNWASKNAPEFVNPRTKEYREGLDWARNVLAAESNSKGDWIIPAKVAPIVFGMLYRSQNQEPVKVDEEIKKKTEEAYQKGAKDSEALREEKKSRSNKPPAGGKKSTDSPATDREKQVMERLGLRPEKLGLLRKLKKDREAGTIEVR